jgi:DNA-binding PadR family transcriptional regulator
MMEGASDGWTRAWLIPFLLLSRRRYRLTREGEAYLEFLARSLTQNGKEIEPFFLTCERQLAPEVRG